MMAMRDYSDRTTHAEGRITAFFRERDNAFSALQDLREAGFSEAETGIAYADEDYSGSAARETRGTGEQDKSTWDKVKDFFSGEEDTSQYEAGYDTSFGHMDWGEERGQHYQSGIASGGAIVTVSGPRAQEAGRILEDSGGDLRESGFESLEPAAARPSSEGGRIQLRGEMLRTYRERSQVGEARLRKEVVTENRTVDVPVTREELVIERSPAGEGQQASGDIGPSEEEIRVPLSEEHARVEKEPVVNEEVRVSKHKVESTEPVSAEVQHEELRVEEEGDTGELRTPRSDRDKRVA